MYCISERDAVESADRGFVNVHCFCNATDCCVWTYALRAMYRQAAVYVRRTCIFGQYVEVNFYKMNKKYIIQRPSQGKTMELVFRDMFE